MKILLTGSSGWLGRHLAPLLTQRGDAVLGLDIAPGPHTQAIGSVADSALIDRLFDAHGFDAVLHAGALHKPDIARYPTQAFVDVNVSGTLALLEAAIRTGTARFIFTSTTSLMISSAIREGREDAAVWLDESLSPLLPRNIYGVTKLAAEQLCRLAHFDHGLPILILRTGRFFPEEDDTHRALSGENMKANELLHRRLTAEDAAAAHVAALDRAGAVGFGTYILSAPTPFTRNDVCELKRDAPAVIARLYPDAAELYAQRGWTLPHSIDRVYDAGLAERELGFRCATDFGTMLAALRAGSGSPVAHDADYVSPKERTDANGRSVPMPPRLA
jgi:nucleoside-diphosphate-sugar epimerase